MAVGGGVGHAYGGLVEGGGEALLGEAESGFGAEALVALAGVGELAFDGREQALEVALKDVVVGAGAHGIDGGDFVDGAGDDDEGKIDAAVLDDLQGVARAEAGQRVVGYDEVPWFGVGEGVAKLIGGFHPACVHGVSCARQMALQQRGILLVVLDEEDMKGKLYRIYWAGGH